jgi:hypothetical protein
MKLRHVLSKRIDHEGEGFSVRAAIDAALDINVNESNGEATATGEPPAGDHETKEASDA